MDADANSKSSAALLILTLLNALVIVCQLLGLHGLCIDGFSLFSLATSIFWVFTQKVTS